MLDPEVKLLRRFGEKEVQEEEQYHVEHLGDAPGERLSDHTGGRKVKDPRARYSVWLDDDLCGGGSLVHFSPVVALLS